MKLSVFAFSILVTFSHFAHAAQCGAFSEGPAATVINNEPVLTLKDGKTTVVLKSPKSKWQTVIWHRPPALSPDKSLAAFIGLDASGGSIFGSAKLHVFDTENGKEVANANVSNDVTEIIFPAKPGVVLAHGSKIYMAMNFRLDHTVDKDLPTVFTEVIRIADGKVMKTIAHNLGWDHYEQLDGSHIYYKPEFRIVWADSGEFFAKVNKKSARIFSVNTETWDPRLEREIHLGSLRQRAETPADPTDAPISKFERELAAKLDKRRP